MRPDGYWYDYIMIVMNICVYRSADGMQRIVFLFMLRVIEEHEYKKQFKSNLGLPFSLQW